MSEAEVASALGQRLTAMRESGRFSPAQLETFSQWVARAPDEELYRTNPFDYASAHALAPLDAIDLLVHAARAGIFDFAWGLVCPNCTAFIASRGGLKSFDRQRECAMCGVQAGSHLDDLVEVTFTVNRCYHHEGRLCRIFYIRELGSELREEHGPKPHEIETLQLAAWVASKHFATPPLGIRLVYHVLCQDDRESPVLKSWVVDLPLTDPQKFENALAAKLKKLEAVLRNPDDTLLPPCTITERHGTELRPFQKCKDYCRARGSCPQYAAFRAKAAEIPGLTEDGKGSSSFSFIVDP